MAVVGPETAGRSSAAGYRQVDTVLGGGLRAVVQSGGAAVQVPTALPTH
ncbi:hypothetical protein SAMN05660642_00815 [Geodermatophilus siccatus]|uniref:Uncharacterized protein n=1 Tax=Geodermatophilus siccatus TaxID=1137991 RepID=A0A1G9MX96_9ACTN|nr:hypothetical protein [Geodermatophilus siccatus]SDL78916.1 hypothetical protein SAMN05660642_00815 [Geodermatophilus siccatus]